MEEVLRSLGFQNDVTAKFVGRYLYQGLIVDFMPLKEDVLGFTNRWYSEAFKSAQTMHIDKNTTIKIFTAPYFIASKLEAFKNRGKNVAGEYDGRVSSDFEDIIFVLANRQSIWAEMDQTDKPLKEYLRQEFINLLGNPYFEEWIDVHSDYNIPIAQAVILPQARLFVQNG